MQVGFPREIRCRVLILLGNRLFADAFLYDIWKQRQNFYEKRESLA